MDKFCKKCGQKLRTLYYEPYCRKCFEELKKEALRYVGKNWRDEPQRAIEIYLRIREIEKEEERKIFKDK